MLSGLVTLQKGTCDLGWWWQHKAASSAVLFSFSTKAVVLSLAPQTLFSPHSAQGQGRINMQHWWLILNTMQFNACPLYYSTQKSACHHIHHFMEQPKICFTFLYAGCKQFQMVHCEPHCTHLLALWLKTNITQCNVHSQSGWSVEEELG